VVRSEFAGSFPPLKGDRGMLGEVVERRELSGRFIKFVKFKVKNYHRG
jgi:hypothetical protein